MNSRVFRSKEQRYFGSRAAKTTRLSQTKAIKVRVLSGSRIMEQQSLWFAHKLAGDAYLALCIIVVFWLKQYSTIWSSQKHTCMKGQHWINVLLYSLGIVVNKSHVVHQTALCKSSTITFVAEDHRKGVNCSRNAAIQSVVIVPW